MRRFLFLLSSVFLVLFMLSCAAGILLLQALPEEVDRTLQPLLLAGAICSALALAVHLLLLCFGRGRRRFAKRYNKTAARLSPPDIAQTAVVCADLPGYGGIAIVHRCWIENGSLALFPLWDSLESNLRLLEKRAAVRYQDLHVQEVLIPMDRIRCFQSTQDGRLVVLLYRGALDEDVGMLLTQDSYPVLQALLPDKEYLAQQRITYPRSARQIADITQRMHALKELRVQALIDEAEYLEKKAEILTGI